MRSTIARIARRVYNAMYRWRWPVRIIIVLVLLVWWGPAAFDRLSAVPPLPPEAAREENVLRIPPKEVDRSQDMAAALNKLPATSLSIPAPTTAPAGKEWLPASAVEEGSGGWPGNLRLRYPGLSGPQPTAGNTFTAQVDEALRGEWSPDTRLALPQIAAYVRTQAVTDALSAIAALADQPFCLPTDLMVSLAQSPTAAPAALRVMGGGLSAGSQISYERVHEAIRLLLVRARYHVAQKGDVHAAAADARVALQLASGVMDDGPALRFGEACLWHGQILMEVGNWTREMPLSRAQVQVLLALVDEHALDLATLWQQTIATERLVFQTELTTNFAPAEKGGWLFLRRRYGDTDDTWLAAINLLAFAMNDRVQTQRRGEAALAKLAFLWGEGGPRIDEIHDQRRAYEWWVSPVDPPFLQHINNLPGIYTRAICAAANEVGARAAIALALYKADHGTYPAVLEPLVPDYLPVPPIDPASGKLLRYEQTGEGYRLWSVGPDGRDDQGIAHNYIYVDSAVDLPLAAPRPGPVDDCLLVPIAETAP